MKKGVMKVSVVLVIVLILGMLLSACQPAGTTAPTSVTAKYKIGLNNLFKGGYPLDILELQGKYVSDVAGMDFFSVNDEGKVEKVVQDVQSLISSGCDGLEIFCVVETLFPGISQNAIDGKTPFVLYDKIPMDPTIRQQILDNPYFKGGVGSQDYNGGVAIATYANELGLKNAIIMAAQQGDPTHDARIKGFEDTFKGTLLAVAHSGANNITDYANKTDDMLTANPNADCIYGTGGDFAQGAIIALQNHADLKDKVKVFATDIDPTLLGKLKDGSISALNGAHFVNNMFTTCLLINALDGHPILDPNGKPPIIQSIQMPVLPAAWADLYQRFWMDGQPYSPEEVKSLLWRYNPNINYQTFADKCAAYSIVERLNQKLKEGAVTKAELEAAGVPIT
jgi:ribose transport system substrate-binding protein